MKASVLLHMDMNFPSHLVKKLQSKVYIHDAAAALNSLSFTVSLKLQCNFKTNIKISCWLQPWKWEVNRSLPDATS